MGSRRILPATSLPMPDEDLPGTSAYTMNHRYTRHYAKTLLPPLLHWAPPPRVYAARTRTTLFTLRTLRERRQCKRHQTKIVPHAGAYHAFHSHLFRILPRV